MAYKKVPWVDDPITGFTGTAYRLLLVNSAGQVAELAHGAANKVLTSQGASADPTWEDSAGGAHALDAGQTDVTITTPADNEVLAYDSGGTNWINQTASEAGLMTDPLTADCVDGTKVADDAIDSEHIAADAIQAEHIDETVTDITLSQIILTPKTDGSGTAGGTLYFDSDTNHFMGYVPA